MGPRIALSRKLESVARVRTLIDDDRPQPGGGRVAEVDQDLARDLGGDSHYPERIAPEDLVDLETDRGLRLVDLVEDRGGIRDLCRLGGFHNCGGRRGALRDGGGVRCCRRGRRGRRDRRGP